MTISVFNLFLAHGELCVLVDAAPPSPQSISFGSVVRGNYILTRSLPNNQCLTDADFARPFSSFTEGESMVYGLGRHALS